MRAIDGDKLIEGLKVVDKELGLKGLLPMMIQAINHQPTIKLNSENTDGSRQAVINVVNEIQQYVKVKDNNIFGMEYYLDYKEFDEFLASLRK